MTETPFPFSRLQAVDNLPALGATVTITATEQERGALAKFLDLLAVDELGATFKLTAWRKTGVKLVGEVHAKLRQACVVTLEPVEEEITEKVELTFHPDVAPPKPDVEIALDPNAEDPPEPLEGNAIDIGAIAAEYMAIALNPYPRAPGAVFEPLIEDDGGEDERPAAFSALAALKDKKT